MSAIAEHSILNSVKKLLGLDENYDVFDQDIIIHINSAFGTLNQLGIGPKKPFFIDDDQTKWSSFTGYEGEQIHPVKTYVYFKVRLAFDPPSTSFGISAITDQIKELEWRLNVSSDHSVQEEYQDPP